MPLSTKQTKEMVIYLLIYFLRVGAVNKAGAASERSPARPGHNGVVPTS